ncbi:unnamed protein product [Rotaria magnacalcarata]|uniref:Thioredoxin domain-containing protein n=1 Tax=Rotaria magnacalcarata TaxID=392030 RepID=A0A815C2J1_9BILA|nr:unnamed protein product [Rotaria magnacalcarata]CAF1959674.1 unnamed protein product [Rotaria magnacalcarata]CAF2149362.1 unnamed protein product [Rotaria magnacalcarata]CAF2228476.1 unnamed protein product [Rotaria magnacalcarata]
MAKSTISVRTRWIDAIEFKSINNTDDALAKSQEAPGKLFMILCNKEYAEGDNIETRLKRWRNDYEINHDVRLFKCIIEKMNIGKPEKFNVQRTPTFVFIRDGKEISRIDNLDESNPMKKSDAKHEEESNDEKRVKELLNELCTKP